MCIKQELWKQQTDCCEQKQEFTNKKTPHVSFKLENRFGFIGLLSSVSGTLISFYYSD